MDQYQLLSNILSFTIATQIPELKPVFWQHLQYDENLTVKNPHGSWYGNQDFIKYYPGTKVNAHVDHKDLNDKRNKHFGPFIVYKLGKSGSDQMLCAVSDKSSGCQWNRALQPGDKYYGGHHVLPPGTIYWMFDEGAYGGNSHAIHNAQCGHDQWDKNLFGGFESKSYTLVMRPKYKDVTIMPKHKRISS